jgi:D-3-phosphoglycerate dehydrogenase / 2-oxoglutarate reductase
MPRPLVVVTDSPFPDLNPAREALSQIDAEIQFLSDSTPEAIACAARTADAVLVTYAKISGEVIRQMQRCRIISRFGIGVDNVDISAATDAGIVVTRVPDYCVEEVADHTLALLLALARKVAFANSLVQATRWEMSATVPIHRLRGTTLGLLGYGRIPQLVSPRAKAFGMLVIACDPYLSSEVKNQVDVELVPFDELLRRSDFVSIHSPLMPETRHLFNAEAFRKMKPTAYLINTARGAIVDDRALAEALNRGALAGAALDVLPEEPPETSPLLGRANVIITPHMSFYSDESLIELQKRAAQEVVRVIRGERPINPVNPGVLKTKDSIAHEKQTEPNLS